MPVTASKPVQSLRDHAKALEAAIVVCAADPKKRAVHKLRSQTRRVEAQIILLRALKELPPFRTEAAAVNRELRKVRRAAGHVRDLDVHDELLAAFITSLSSESHEAGVLREEARKLQEQQGAEREKVAAKLVQVLTRRQADLTLAIEHLLAALKPAAALSVPATAMVELAEAQFARLGDIRISAPARAAPETSAGSAKSRKAKRRLPDEDHLHTIRKAAKAVRYILESVSGSRRASEIARQFEALQESGGQWHDWLELSAAARRVLGGKHALTREFKQRRDRHHTGYLAALTHRGVS